MRAEATVIIVTYNAAEELPACLDSVFAACPGCEVLVVDNASADRTAEVARERYPRARLLCRDRNGGYGEGNNLGACVCDTPYLVFLNPDTVVEPGWLEALTGALEQHPECGLATPQIVQLREASAINTCGLDVHFTGLALCRMLGAPREARGDAAEVPAISGAAFAIRREVFRQLGGFDPAFFLYMEDVDLSWRARLAGYGCLYVPTAVVRHDYRLRFGPSKTYWQERNRYLMLLKSLRWRTLLLMLPGLALSEVVTWGFVLLRERGHLRNKMAAYGWLLAHWPAVLRARRRTQAIRARADRDLLSQCAYRLCYEQTGAGPLAVAAHVVFDRLYRVCYGLTLALVKW